MESVSFQDQLQAAIRATLSEPSGRLAIAWALNLRLNKALGGVNNPHVMGDANQSAYNEGIRQAGQSKLEYLRMFMHDEYQALMGDLLTIQANEHMLDMQNRKPLQEET